MSSRQFPLVAVIKGGPSSEREVSLSSGQAVAAALRGEGFDVVEIDAGENLCAQLKELGPVVVFNALHGRFGEDGVVQGLLEWMRIPYTHSGVLASATAMDKEKTKELYKHAGLPISGSILRDKADISSAHVMEAPYVVKPFNDGSSVGVYIVQAGDPPPDLSADMPDLLMVERYVPGRELTCSVLGDKVLCVTEMQMDGWYDYEAKYSEGGSQHICPAELPDEITQACKSYALKAHKVLGCRGLSRTDFRWDEAKGLDGLVLLETNTQPGMTATSLSPEQAQAVGMTYGELCKWLVEDASCDR